MLYLFIYLLNTHKGSVTLYFRINTIAIHILINSTNEEL